MSKYPKPDRSNFIPNFNKTTENDELDIGWNEGKFSDSRPYRVEYWCVDGVSSITFFTSTKDIEDVDNDFFINFFKKENLIVFTSERVYLSAAKLIDPSNNELWSINLVIGYDENVFANPNFDLNLYKR